MPETPNPSDIFPDLIEELEELRELVQERGVGAADTTAWADPLMNTSTDFLRQLADFRDGVRKKRGEYPDEDFEELDSPDLNDPDLVVWHELTEWFSPELREERWG